MPFVVRNDFHISKDEYESRCRFQWPDDLPGMTPVSELPVPPTPTFKKQGKSRSKPNIEVATAIGNREQEAMDEMFVPTNEVQHEI